MAVFGFLKKLVGPVFGIIDKSVKDKDLAEKLKHDIQMAAMNGELAEIEEQAKVIIAEAQGESWLQRNWRPVTMLTFVTIIANNYILVPYAVSFGLEVPMLEIPPGMWSLLTVGIGGYIGSRGYEKIRKMEHEAELRKLQTKEKGPREEAPE